MIVRSPLRGCWALILFLCASASADNETTRLLWASLPPLPQALGGAVAGTHGDALLVASGTYFNTPPWDGGTKTWVRDVYVLPAPDAAWVTTRDALPTPRAYASVVSLTNGVLLMGGSDGVTHSREVTLLQWTNGALSFTDWPPFPVPHAMGGAAVLGDIVYAGLGLSSPLAVSADSSLFALDTKNLDEGWKPLEAFPGPARILPVFAAQSGSVYVFSGASLRDDGAGKAQRTYLTDGWRFQPKTGWTEVAGPPQATVAAPAAAMGTAHIMVFSGDDGSLADRIDVLRDTHPGFSKSVLGYHTITDTWAEFGQIDPALVTTNATPWRGQLVIPGGEDRPAHRSAAVVAVKSNPAHRSIVGLDYAVMIAYFLILVLIGYYCSKREHTSDDYFLGGRRVPWWAAGLSIFGTVLSAITFLAVPAMAFSTNWVYLVGNLMVFAIAPIVVYLYLPFFRRLHVTSAYEYLELRFNLAARLFGSLSFTVFQLSRMGIVLYLPAIALTAATGMDIRLSIVATGVVATVYTVLGGIEAVIWTDVVQVLVLAGGALVALAMMLLQIDGSVWEFMSVGWNDGKFRMANWSWDYTIGAFWVVLIGRTLENLVPYTTDQSVVQRYLTTPTEKKAAQAIWLGVLMALPSSFLFFTLGTALYVFYKQYPQELDPGLLKADAIFPLFIVEQIPAGITGLIIAAIFAASMSTLDSSLNSVSTVMVADFYRRFARNANDRTELVLARILTTILGIIATGTAILMTMMDITSLWEQYMKYVGLFGGSLAGLFALGIFTKRANGTGALIGALTGASVLVFVQQRTAVSFLLYSAIGISTSFIMGYLASFVVGQNRDLTGVTWWTRPQSGSEDTP